MREKPTNATIIDSVYELCVAAPGEWKNYIMRS
jgi:hypothetical protein